MLYLNVPRQDAVPVTVRLPGHCNLAYHNVDNVHPDLADTLTGSEHLGIASSHFRPDAK